VRSGPYAFMRNPICTGPIDGALGTAIAVGEPRGLVGVVCVRAALSIRAKTEERFLCEEFGAAFADHARRVTFLIPIVL
jgi:protein-S-isoprenylcysteine O-methyltransferase Ste14